MPTNSLDHMHDRLDGASSVLVLSPLTTRGTEAYMELIATSPADETNVIAVTYTLSPEQWLGHWRAHTDSLPANYRFVHGETTETASGATEDEGTTATTFANPRDPKEIGLAIDDALTAWDDDDTPAVVSFQTLTVLLAYVDLETAFRHLHALLSRVETAGAVGYYQIDPDVQDRETIDTLAVLFDAVVGRPDDGDDSTVRRAVLTVRRDADSSGSTADESLLSPLRSHVSRLGHIQWPGTPSDRPETATSSDASHDRQESRTVDSTRPPGVADERLLADHERIERLLVDRGGRLKQCDIVEETEWSRSSVSRKLSKMEADGRITRIQIGRTNLVYLPGHEPSEASPPFDGESISRTS